MALNMSVAWVVSCKDIIFSNSVGLVKIISRLKSSPPFSPPGEVLTVMHEMFHLPLNMIANVKNSKSSCNETKIPYPTFLVSPKGFFALASSSTTTFAVGAASCVVVAVLKKW